MSRQWVDIIVAICAAIPATLVAYATLRSTWHLTRQLAANSTTTAAVLVETGKIHTLANSKLTGVQADLSLATQRISELELLIQKLEHRVVTIIPVHIP